MSIEIEIVSRHTIKPWKPNANDLKTTYKLCLLDQLAPSFYVPLVLFYSFSNVSDVVERLKISLSKTLAQFYPLAGKIYDAHVEVGENDGVSFVEARADSELSAVLEKPDTRVVQKLLPIDPYGGDRSSGEGVPALAVQANEFRCGGTALGICLHHRIADGTTLSAFLSAWSRASLSGGSVPPPRLDAADTFPPRDIHVENPRSLINSGEVVARRFVFDSAGLSRLRAEASSSGGEGLVPTRVEAVTALISKAAASPEKPMLMTHVVNLRPRMSPALPEDFVGNVWRCAAAVSGPGEPRSLGGLAGRLREEIRKLDGGYAHRLGTEEGFEMVCQELKGASELVSSRAVPFYKFSSWVRFPIYRSDFGFGAPVWACVTTVPIDGTVILMGNKSGDGIEAWVNLTESDMSLFETNPELLKFASLAPGS